MRYLSLFSGAGGGDLAAQHLLEWEWVGYVEWDSYCQRLLRQRQDDGYLDVAPIYGDVREFISDRYAAAYTGMVDVITAGFPCQPFSAAGKQRGADDDRNMWPATIRCINVVRPRYVLLENVRGLLSSGYFGTVLGDLAEGGYDARWRLLSAAEVGAPHRRDRLWIAAVDNTVRNGREAGRNNHGKHERDIPCPTGKHATPLAYTNRGRQQERHQKVGQLSVSNTQGGGKQWWEAEPDVGRVVDGMAHRVDRLKAIGNGQVPAVAAMAWHLLATS